jgi:hypothetical protein
LKSHIVNLYGEATLRCIRRFESLRIKVDNHFTRQYIPEDNSEHRTRRRENLKSHEVVNVITGTGMLERE